MVLNPIARHMNFQSLWDRPEVIYGIGMRIYIVNCQRVGYFLGKYMTQFVWASGFVLGVPTSPLR